MDIIFIGNLAKDYNIFDRALGSQEVAINNGGASYYSAVGASRYAKVGIVSKVGSDFDLDNLRHMGIDSRGVQVVDGETTKFYQHFHSLDGQQREFYAEINPNTNLTLKDVPSEYLKDVKYIMLSTTLPEMQLQMIKELRKVTNAKIAVDTLLEYSNIPLTRQVFDMADIAFIDKEFNNLVHCNAPEKILKLGKEGSVYFNKTNYVVYRTPDTDIIKDVTDKTGAGDVLAGVFLAVLSQTDNPSIALTIANQVATESIKKHGVEHLAKISLPKIPPQKEQ